jgi:putative membrane protein insertion efficiency factor
MNPGQSIALLLIRIYQWTVSPLKSLFFGAGGCCRFNPTCSQYAYDAIRARGVCGGSWLALRRILRCHPWGGSGYDPAPRKS